MKTTAISPPDGAAISRMMQEQYKQRFEKPTTYNGHKNWAHWNVALWIGNDEGLYRLALDCKRNSRGKSGKAAREFIKVVGFKKTPDGAAWSITNVRAALSGLE